MLFSIFLCVAGFGVLYFGAEWLVKGSDERGLASLGPSAERAVSKRREEAWVPLRAHFW